MFLKTDGAGNLSFSSDLPTTSFTGATVETSIADSDLVLIYDDSATAVRKMTKANLVAGIGASAGQVIQVITATDSTERSTSSSTFVTASNTLSLSITPSSASNKVFVTAGFAYGTPSGTASFNTTLFRGATNLGSATNGFGNLFDGDSYEYSHATLQILDSPNTTSATTYQVYFKTASGTAIINNSGSFSSITAFEVKG